MHHSVGKVNQKNPAFIFQSIKQSKALLLKKNTSTNTLLHFLKKVFENGTNTENIMLAKERENFDERTFQDQLNDACWGWVGAESLPLYSLGLHCPIWQSLTKVATEYWKVVNPNWDMLEE